MTNERSKKVVNTALQPEFWAGRRVFVTGHTGFKGSWLTQWLVDAGAEVCGYALEPDEIAIAPGYRPLFEELGLADRIKHHVGDVRDGEMLARKLRNFAPDIVMHLAAQPLVRRSYRDPVDTYATNVMGTVNLLEACREQADLSAVIIITSDKCYENREQIWGYRESDPMGGHDPYSNSKGCAELVTSAYRKSFFDSVTHSEKRTVICSARAGNVIGGGDWSEDRLIPDAMRAMCAGTQLSVRNPAATRPWQHVLDPISGYLRLAELSVCMGRSFGQGWNFGPGDDMNLTVNTVISGLSVASRGQLTYRILQDRDAPHEATLLKLDCTAARSLLGWSPLYNAEEMLQMTMDWYRGANATERQELTLAQIKDAQARIASL